jgi:V/A-type H+-transporting ATPase subunit E
VSGLSNIIDLIESRANEKIELIIQEAEEQREKVLKRTREKAKTNMEKGLKEAKFDFELELVKYGASATLKGKHRVLRKKEELLKDVLKIAIDQIKKKTKTKEYKEILTRLAVEGALILNEKEVQLVFPEGHEKKVKVADIAKRILDETGNKIEVSVSEDHIRSMGGVKIQTPDASKWVDNSFEARLERLERQIRDTIAELLFVGKRW